MGAKKCIICGKDLIEGKAAKVKEDFIIDLIRKVKGIFGLVQGNELYVCENDIENHAKKRKKFERDLVIMSTIAVLLVLIVIGVPMLSGRFELTTMFSSIMIGLVIVALTVIFEYTPAIGPLEDINLMQLATEESTKEYRQKKQPQKLRKR